MKSFGSSIVSILLAASLFGLATAGYAATQMSPKLRAEQARTAAIKSCQKDCEKKKDNKGYEACMLDCSKANYKNSPTADSGKKPK